MRTESTISFSFACFAVHTQNGLLPVPDNLGVRAVRGVAWLGSGQVIRQVLAFATNIVLARMLFPDDFGLFGMAFAATEVAQILTDFGLGAALIQRRESNPIALTTCFWLNMALGLLVCTILIVLAPIIATFFRRPEITWILIPLAANMVIAASMVVPQALLTQQLKFREMTMAQTIGSIVASIGSISLAMAGAGVWALVLQPVIGNVCSCAVMYFQARWWPRGYPEIGAVRHMLVFSGQLLGNNLLSCIGRNLHAAILGRQLGSSALGMYNLASGMTGTIVFQVSSVIVRVLFPTLSSLREQPERLAAAWLKACAAIAIIAFPAMAGMIAVAPDLVPVVFGEQWSPAISVLRILCVVMAFQSVLTTSGTVLMALGRADLLLRSSVASIAIVALGLLVGATYGLEAAAIGYAFGAISSSLLVTYLACREAGVRFHHLANELVPWILSSLVMAIGVVALSHILSDLLPGLRLAICVLCGAMAYVIVLFMIAPIRTRGLFNDVFSRLSGRKG